MNVPKLVATTVKGLVKGGMSAFCAHNGIDPLATSALTEVAGSFVADMAEHVAIGLRDRGTLWSMEVTAALAVAPAIQAVLNERPDDAGAVVQSLLAADNADETLSQGFWAQMQALDPAVHRCLAAMTADYLVDNRPSDQLFKRVGLLLQTFTAKELVVLSQLFEGWLPHVHGPRETSISRERSDLDSCTFKVDPRNEVSEPVTVVVPVPFEPFRTALHHLVTWRFVTGDVRTLFVSPTQLADGQRLHRYILPGANMAG